MSLIVTSNKALENAPSFSNSFKPFSYQNRLLNTMKIPPNSEIALQSAKINKNGLFILDRSNSGFCHYFGTPVEEVHSGNIDDTTTQPFRAVIGAGEAFRAGDIKNEVNIEDMAAEIQKGINEAVFHPSLITGTNTTSVVVSAEYNTGGSGEFKGFKFVATQATAKTTRNVFPDDAFTDVSKNNRGGFTQAAGVVTSSVTSGFNVMNREYPISQNQGTCTINFSDANSGGRWFAGLSRVNKPIDTGAGTFEYLPNYFEYGVNGATNQGIRYNGAWNYADISVRRVGTELKVFQSGARTIGTGKGIYMNEIVYYGGHNEKFPQIYDINTNGNTYRKVKFVLNNEEVSIFMIRANGAEDLLCDFTTMRSNTNSEGQPKPQATKNQCINPINATEWSMYPVMGVSGAVNVGKTMTLESLDHYTNYPEYDDSTYFNHDWWGWSQTYNQTAFCREVETRDWNNYSRTTTNHGGGGANGLLVPKKVNGGGGMADYDSLIITARSEEYGDSTNLTNTQYTLGFAGEPVSNPSAGGTDVVTTNESSTVPKLTSNISLFIRLNNFTQTTMNARMGTLSKIVAHLPRFDNSGNETGGLYFEPHEKTYLALNNTEPIYINSFDVDIVYENETLCTALTGKTIICFHIREKK
jgi:hypothetical protein